MYELVSVMFPFAYLATFQPSVLKVGQGSLPDELIPELKEKLLKVFQLKK